MEGHATRLSVDSDLIHEVQNQVRKCEDMVKQKANGDEIDSLNTFLHELYERLTEIEKNGIKVTTTGGDGQNSAE